MSESKPVFLASDVHFGAAPPDHERAFLAWLGHATAHASEIILNGDLFDFWFEYRWGVSRGHDELLEALRSTVCAGVPVTLVGGNHDWWGGAYLRDEVGLVFLTEPTVRRIAGRSAFLAHGDGLGDADPGYAAMRLLLRSALTRWSFSMLPVSLGDGVARHVSSTRERWDHWTEKQEARSTALEAWAEAKLRAEPELDLVLLGHTHRPILREVGAGRWYVNSGDWVRHQSYVVLADGSPPEMRDWRDRDTRATDASSAARNASERGRPATSTPEPDPTEPTAADPA